MRELTCMQAAYEGLKKEISGDPNVYLMKKEDIFNKKYSGVSDSATLINDKVVNMPKSEATIVSSATGLALIGLRPVIELNQMEDIFLAFSALVDQVAKLRYMSGGKLMFPITYLCVEHDVCHDYDALRSENPYSFLIHGGMKVVIASCAYDAKGLLVSAIRDNDPVAVFLPTRVLAEKGEVPEEQYAIPLGKAEIKKIGSDITVVAAGHCVNIALDMALKLDTEGISVEVFDPRTLFPFDKKTLERSISKTGKVVIIDDSPKTCGFASMVSSILMEEYYEYLKRPVRRITREDIPIPFSKSLKKYVLPNSEKLENAIRSII
ncbi:MAG: alpha-ketoacid dehydrogenase subunit beta [Candidatus Humimicrobiaceae bacterium]